MNLELIRYSSQKESTLGLLMNVSGSSKEFLCYTLEDEYRTKKVWGETRIPDGTYEIKFRKKGGFHARYTKKFGTKHYGMLELQNVIDFKYVLIHIGNDDDDSAGCILVGDQSIQNLTKPGFIGRSTQAYKRVYAKIAGKLKREKVFIHIKTID